ncbi:MAG: PilZ domain-containing protein [Halorhodospira sp.]
MAEEHEKRRFSRVEFHAPAQLVGMDGTSHEVQLLDLSMRGALVRLRSDELPETLRDPESVWTLELALSATDHIRMEVSPAHWHEHEVGLACQRIDLDSMVHLRSLLEANLGDTELIHRELRNLIEDH